MRQLRQLLRLARDGASARDIAVTLGVARSTIQDNLKRAAAAGLSWPLPGELTDDALEGKLFGRAGVRQGVRRRPEPNWADLVIEMKKPGRHAADSVGGISRHSPRRLRLQPVLRTISGL